MDTDGLRDMATRLRTVASEVDLTADQQAKDAHNAHWVSTSGDLFRESSLELRTSLLDSSAHLTSTAARLDAVADTVDERVAAIAAAAAAAQAAEDFVEDVAEGVSDTVDDVVEGVGDVAEGIAEGAGQVGDGLARAAENIWASLPGRP